MIISVSRRTDIPAFYSSWFFNRLKAGFVLVPNPRISKQLSRISLSPDIIDCIVFWTKNPSCMLNKLAELSEYSFYFQFTLTAYQADIENTSLLCKNELQYSSNWLSKLDHIVLFGDMILY